MASATVRKRLRKLSRDNNISQSSLVKVFNRGMGASVSSGTRGMSPTAWSYARVNSFIKIVKGKKSMKHDKDLVRKERKRRRG